MTAFLIAGYRSVRGLLRYRDRNNRLAIIATLAMTLAAGIAIAAVVNAVWLKPLPFSQPEQLYVIWHSYPGLGVPKERVDAPGFDFYRRARTPFSELAVATPARSINLATDAGADPVAARQVSITPNYFNLFGVAPARGRAFTAEDAQRGAAPVAIVSHALWTRHFGGAAVSGQTLSIDGETVRIVGVLPPAFQVLERSDIWRPFGLSPRMIDPSQLGNEFLTVFGRARADATPAAITKSMSDLTAGIRAQYPAAHSIDPRWHLAAAPLRDEMLGAISRVVPLLVASVAVLVIVGFVNVANLVLARSIVRRHDAAVKIALGASRGRLFVDYIADGVVLSALGTAIGVLLAGSVLQTMLAIVLDEGDLMMPPWSQVRIDGAVILFGLAVAALCALTCALVPAWGDLMTPVISRLGGAERTTLGRGQRRLLSGLVTFEVATASLLVVASGLLVESIVRLSRVDPGFQSDRVSAFGLVLPQRKYPNQASVRALQTQLMDRMAATPGVEAAGFVSALPFRQPGIAGVVQIEGQQAGAEQRPLQTSFLLAGGSYFQAMSIPLRRGRLFGPRDLSDGMPVVVIDDAAARFFWPTTDPIGKRLNFTFEKDKNGQPVWREVVGVVGHVRTQQLQAGTDFQFYAPVDQGSARGVTYVVRGAPSRPDLAAVVRDSVRAVDPDLPLHDLQPMTTIVAESFALLRAAVAVVGAFGTMAAVLTGIGVYGVISFLVALRKRELGVKLALGATASQIRSEVMGAALRLAAIGVILAVPAALALSWSIRSLLFGVSPFNPWIQVGAAIVILGLVALASYGPAKTATHIDPVQTLRQG